MEACPLNGPPAKDMKQLNTLSIIA